MDKLRPRSRSGALRRGTPLRRARFSVYTHFAFKKKNPLDLQVFSQIDKTMKKLQ